MRVTRRQWLTWAAGSALWLAAGCQPRPAPPAPALNEAPVAPSSGAGGSTQATPPPAGDGLSQTVRVTPTNEFFIVAIGAADHRVAMDTWRFELTGRVDRPLSLTLADIRALPSVQFMRTLECISNPAGGDLIGNAWWEGVSMAALLDMAGVQRGAVEVKVYGDDGFKTSIPLDLARDPHAYLTHGMNGAPLPVEHGHPLRVMWPGRYGMKQPKWVTRIEVLDEPYLGHWEKQGWTNEAVIKPNSQIRVPNDGARVGLGPLTISGTAFADPSGVAQVEVSVDDGQTWQPAELIRAPEPFRPTVWTEWRATWTPQTTGRVTLAARVTDGASRVQERRAFSLLGGTFPDGTDGIHSITVTLESR